VEAVRQRVEALERVAADHAHAARSVVHDALAERAQDPGEDAVADRADQRHLAVRPHPGAEHQVRALLVERAAQLGEGSRVARAVGVEEAHQVAAAVLEAALERGAVAAVPLEPEHGHVVEALRDLLGAIGGAVAHDHDVHIEHRAVGGDVLTRFERAPQRVADRFLFVQRRNHDRQHVGAGHRGRSVSRDLAPTREAAGRRQFRPRLQR
jgi:hypothetical protein